MPDGDIQPRPGRVSTRGTRDRENPICRTGSAVLTAFALTEEVVGLGGYGKTLTVLTAQEAIDADELQEDEEMIESWKPRFRR